MDKKKLSRSVRESSECVVDGNGKEWRCLSLDAARRIAAEYGSGTRLIEIAALEEDIVPSRYRRNIGTVGIAGQLRLLGSAAGIVGVGGLGGFVIELLARMGVGRITVIDDDSFSESNLNRQLLSIEENLGVVKIEAAVERIAAVNSAVEVEAHCCRGDSDNFSELLEHCELVIDCLDNLPSRFALEAACSQLKLPLVHGAIAGFLGQVAVIRPGKPVLRSVYGRPDEGGSGRGVETELGNPAFTPAMLASFQAAEAVKYLAGLESLLPPNILLIIDLQSGETYRIEIGGPGS
ncbi:MAG TPA: HesA/MoeB/ThiF family protein [Firmicutes bacterium]|nr:HesA/MoeB/ThiF family protein [Bacillota bacterium]